MSNKITAEQAAMNVWDAQLECDYTERAQVGAKIISAYAAKEVATALEGQAGRVAELEAALGDLVDTYMMNMGTESEFASCVTEVNWRRRKGCKYWKLWQRAKKLTGRPAAAHTKQETQS